MTRIAFLTLFLGLTLSHQKVDLTVAGKPQKVELQLDDRVVAVLTHPPWSAIVDFGTHLLPRRLVARALDADGQEIARAEQKVNVPRAAAETQIVLERDDVGTPRAARLVWQSLEGENPTRAELLLDGNSIPVGADLYARLPAIDNARPHLLRAHLVSRLDVVSDSEIAFGGGLEDATSAELTAVAVHQRDPKEEIRLTVRGSSPVIAGIEQIPGEVIVVRHPIETETSVRLDPTRRIARRRSFPTEATATLVGHLAQFLWPVGTRTGKADLFPRSRTYGFTTADDFKKILTDVGVPGAPTTLRFSDAVAVAGLRALAGKRPRAVILIAGENPSDASRLEPNQVREYLAAAGVPFYVWSFGASAQAQRWSDVRDISTPRGFSAAFDELLRDLESQRIVWLRGDYLPQEIHSQESH